MKKILLKFLENVWYKDHFVGTWLMPLTLIFMDVARFRRWLYKKGYKKTTKLPVPVIIVGNITLGGTGKTPLVIYIVEHLKQAGLKPGVISRGYGGHSEQWPQRVTANSLAADVGDEPVLIAQKTGVPVAVGAIRATAAQMLLDSDGCDVIISDDGLQHYALQRDIEIVVIDGVRRFGNNFCLPGGPLREPQARLQEVDFSVCNGADSIEDGEILMTLEGVEAVNLSTQQRKPLGAFRDLKCAAIAGIGNPQRFFDSLQKHGVLAQNHAFPDHHQYSASDLNLKGAEAILMTEKDAVKCTEFATEQHWYVPVTAKLPADFSQNLMLRLLRAKL